MVHLGSGPPATPKEDGSGYVVEVLVPLRPPLVVQPSLKLRFDASLVLSDAEASEANCACLGTVETAATWEL